MTKLRIRVFGSRASGENREDSDIDVLIEGATEEVERIKSALHDYSVEQGGPLDLFVLGAVDNEVDLVAAYAPPDQPRTVAVGDTEDLEEMLSSAYDITFEKLKSLCETVDRVWNQTSSADKRSANMAMR